MEEVLEIDYDKLAKEKEHLEHKFQSIISDRFYSQSIPLLNKLVGLGGVEQFSLGLFLKLPISFRLEEVKEEEYFVDEELDLNNKYTDQDKVVGFILKNFKAYVVSDTIANKVMVNMVFKYRNEDDLENTLKAIDIEIGSLFIVFVYLHEVQHLLRRHNTSTFNEIMLRAAKGVDPEKYQDYYQDVHKWANFAEDYVINNSLLETLKKGNKKTNFNQELNVISNFGLFNEKYNDLNEIDVLEKLLKQQPDIKVIEEDEHSVTLEIQEKNEEGENDGEPKIVTIPKQGEGEGEGEGENGKNKVENEVAVDKLSDAVAEGIQNLFDEQAEKGDGSFLLNKALGNSIKTNVDWFDKLKSKFFTIVNRKTKETLVSWSKLNSKYRHSHNSPTHKNLDKQLDIVLSVDNSGSMCDESLRKLIYIIEEKQHKINKITILKHTDEITAILEDEVNEKKMCEFLGTRDGGGTSHKEVFKYLDDNIKKSDIDRTIFISFSDNESDIESQYKNYKVIQKITKVWLNADGRNVEPYIPGLKVDIF